MSRLRPNFPFFKLSPYGGGGAGDTAHSDCTINTGPLTDCAVTSVKIQDSTIVAADLADCAVTSAKLGDTSVITAKINNDAVTYAKVQNVTAARLLGRHDATASGDIQEVTLGTGLTFDSSLGTVNASAGDTSHDDCSINTLALTDCAVTSVKIQDSTIATVDLSDCAITAAKLGDTAVVTAKINNDAVTYAKIQVVTASRLLGRHDTTAGIVEEVSVAGGISFDTTLDAIVADTASTTVDGISEHATSAEINTATDTLRILSVREYAQSQYGEQIIQLLITDTTLATGDSQIHFFIPPELDSWDLVDADAAVSVVSTTGTPTIQIRNVTDAADMLSTKITIDSGEKTSYTAAIAPVIDTANDSVVTGNELAIDVDSAGTGAEGLNVILQFRHRGA